MVQHVPGRGAKTKLVVGSGDRTGAGRLTSVAHLAGSSADRPNAWGAGSAGPVPDGLGATALGAAGTRPQTRLVHTLGSVLENGPCCAIEHLPGQTRDEAAGGVSPHLAAHRLKLLQAGAG